MKILCIGDIAGAVGRDMIRHELKSIIEEKGIDLVMANGENAAHGRGITRNVYNELCDLGIEAFTMGNHTWDCREVATLLTHKTNIIRPANYEGECPGSGSMIIEKSGVKVGIVNLIGRIYMSPAACPFAAAKRVTDKIREITPIIIVDFHAEATSEKEAMGWYLDGKVSAVFGTHTHVQTADDMILPKGTGYITDLGMTGPAHSILGMDRHIVIERFLNGMPKRLEIADGKGQFCGAVFDIDNKSGKCVGVERVYIRE